MGRNHSTRLVILKEMYRETNIEPMHFVVTVRSILFLVLMVLATQVEAQDVDHVYLKNGSVIRGKILEIELTDHVKIEDLCGNIWYHKIAGVEKITAEPYTPEHKPGKEPMGFKSGFVNMTSIGFLAGSSNNMQVAPFSLLMVNGWRNSLGIFTGIGIGIELLSANYLPAFLDIRYDLPGGDVVPYVMAKGGYSMPLSSDHSEYDIDYTYSGGPLAGIGAGLKIKSREHLAWDVELMYRYQQASYTEKYNWNNQNYTYTDLYNRIEIRLGFYID